MKKEKLEEFFNNINNAEDLIMYHLFKRGWKFVNVFKSGIMTKGNVFFVIKKYANTNTYDNFMFTENDLDITQINSIQDLKNTDIPLRKNFSPVNTDKCSWYVSYKDKIVEKGSITQSHIFLRSQMEGKEPVKPDNVKKIEKFQEMIDLRQFCKSKSIIVLNDEWFNRTYNNPISLEIFLKHIDRFYKMARNLKTELSIDSSTGYMCIDYKLQ